MSRPTARFVCESCGKRCPEFDSVCDFCGAPAIAPLLEQETEKAPKLQASRASEVTVKDELRCATGIKTWDEVLAGGIVCPSSALLFGQAGVGKTTRAIAIASQIAKELGGDALYGSAEMPQDMIVRFAKRGGADLSRVLIWEGNKTEAFLREIEGHAPLVTVWDSVQAFRTHGTLDERKVALAAIEDARQRKGVTILISQIGKRGDYLGSNSLRHDVDLAIEMYIDHRAQKRVVYVQKHRYGPSPRRAFEE